MKKLNHFLPRERFMSKLKTKIKSHIRAHKLLLAKALQFNHFFAKNLIQTPTRSYYNGIKNFFINSSSLTRGDQPLSSLFI